MYAKLWDPRTLDCVAALDCLGDSVMGLARVGEWLLAGGTRGIGVWDLGSRRLSRTLDGSRWPLLAVEGLLFCTVYDQPQNIQVNLKFPSLHNRLLLGFVPNL
jgi:hypothetical protein